MGLEGIKKDGTFVEAKEVLGKYLIEYLRRNLGPSIELGKATGRKLCEG